MKNQSLIARFKAKSSMERASMKRLLAIAEKLKGRELFPEKIKRAENFFKNLKTS